jgi:hypothetical protein
MTTEGHAVELDDQGLAVLVLRGIVDPGDEQEPSAWESACSRLGDRRLTFVTMHLLQHLFAHGLERGAYTDAPDYARAAHRRSSDPELPALPLWLIEAVIRAPTGEPHLIEGLDPDDVIEAAGFVVRDLVDVTGLGQAEVDDLLQQVARTPMPAGPS